jgi:hypothetical protein
MTLDQEIRRGEEAKRLMEDTILKDAFQQIESGLIDGMKRSNIGDTKTHHEMVLMLQLFERLKGVIHETMETGQLARLQKETLAQRVKRTLRAV